MVSGPFGESVEDFISHRLRQLPPLNVLHLNLKLSFLTPIRLRVQGDLQGGVSFEMLIRSLLRRLWQLTQVHGGGGPGFDHRALIERAKGVSVVRSQLWWLDWTRYSGRQKTRMQLGGLVGEVAYGFGDVETLSEFLPLLLAGELLHVGKNTTFGLGRYEIRA
jgi:hypothetical protein